MAQRRCVVWPYILDMHSAQVGNAGHGIGHAADRGQTTAGKDISLDEIHALPVALVVLIGDGDRLEQHLPGRPEQSGALPEEFVVKIVSDRFDHFDRHELVVLTIQLSVVLLQQRDVILEPRFLYRSGCPGVLLLGNRRGGDPAAVVGGGMKRKTAPAGSDLDDFIASL